MSPMERSAIATAEVEKSSTINPLLFEDDWDQVLNKKNIDSSGDAGQRCGDQAAVNIGSALGINHPAAVQQSTDQLHESGHPRVHVGGRHDAAPLTGLRASFQVLSVSSQSQIQREFSAGVLRM